MKQKIAFLYLNTGGGHIAPARALARGFERLHPDDTSSLLCNGINEDMKVWRFLFEDGYRFSSNFFELAWVLVYRTTDHPWSMDIGNYMLSLQCTKHLADCFRENGITKVVCLHSALTASARRAIDRVNPDIPLITIVTDPYTAHGFWYHEKNTELVVFSEKVRNDAIARKFPAERVHVFPFILNDVYERRYTADEILAAKARLGIPAEKKVILVAGGGEGLKSSDRLVANFLKRDSDAFLVVVCGRNKILKRLIELQVSRSGAKNVLVFGFVSFMPDLLNLADCVITKGGASTVMEVLAVGKPVIFSTFIRGQELGNVLFAVYNGAGWHIKKPEAILDKAEEILGDESISRDIRKKIDALGIRNGLEPIVEFIYRHKTGH
jgi:processive 1,2-diacylglycerol beta-glucosyltransferase/1,2-diacylglycerol 3-beta-galactosyltransferase